MVLGCTGMGWGWDGGWMGRSGDGDGMDGVGWDLMGSDGMGVGWGRDGGWDGNEGWDGDGMGMGWGWDLMGWGWDEMGCTGMGWGLDGDRDEGGDGMGWQGMD